MQPKWESCKSSHASTHQANTPSQALRRLLAVYTHSRGKSVAAGGAAARNGMLHEAIQAVHRSLQGIRSTAATAAQPPSWERD